MEHSRCSMHQDGGQIGIQLGIVNPTRDLKFGLDQVVFQVRGQQPHGAGDTWVRWDDDLRNLQLFGDRGAMHRAGAAEGHQAEATGVNALLHGTRADGIGHIGIIESLGRRIRAHESIDLAPQKPMFDLIPLHS
jgi:hypothetical protein